MDGSMDVFISSSTSDDEENGHAHAHTHTSSFLGGQFSAESRSCSVTSSPYRFDNLSIRFKTNERANERVCMSTNIYGSIARPCLLKSLLDDTRQGVFHMNNNNNNKKKESNIYLRYRKSDSSEAMIPKFQRPASSTVVLCGCCGSVVFMSTMELEVCVQ